MCVIGISSISFTAVGGIQVPTESVFKDIPVEAATLNCMVTETGASSVMVFSDMPVYCLIVWRQGQRLFLTIKKAIHPRPNVEGKTSCSEILFEKKGIFWHDSCQDKPHGSRSWLHSCLASRGLKYAIFEGDEHQANVTRIISSHKIKLQLNTAMADQSLDLKST